MEALICFMCSSPAAESDEILPERACVSSGSMDLGHVLLGAKIGVVDGRVFAGIVLLASQFGVVQATCVAECASSVRSTSPLGSFGAVAAMAAARRSSTSPALLRIRASKSRFHVILVRAS